MSEMDSGTGALEGNLPATTVDGAARDRALTEARNAAIAPTGLVSYVSSGRLALIGSMAESSPVAERIGDALAAVIVSPPGDESGDRGTARVIHASITEVEGHLGAFTLHSEGDDGAPIVVAPSPLTGDKPFDIVIDLRPNPRPRARDPPSRATLRRAATMQPLEEAIEQAADLVGEFEKPRYFGYDPNICAHGASGHPRVHALSRRLPHRRHPLDRRAGRGRSVSLPGRGGMRECVSNRRDDVRISAAGRSAFGLARVPRRVPGSRRTLADAPVSRCGGRCRRVGSNRERRSRIGDPMGGRGDRIDWHGRVGDVHRLGGAHRHARAGTGAGVCPARTRRANWSHSLPFSSRWGMHRHCSRLSRTMRHSTSPSTRYSILQPLGRRRSLRPARSVPTSVSRSITSTTTRGSALTSPISRLPRRSARSMPTVTPCTLCMACVSICPASALQAGGDEPRLSFIEVNCVQCGLCERACPESCITRSPRYLFDREDRRRPRTLNEDQPFHCVSCGKVFGTTSVVMRMQQRLAGHSMFQAPGALARLRMCEDCRVKDMFRSEAHSRE